jgi:predicted S18 family serine protease
MNVDLTSTFKDSKNLLNTWNDRYSREEYPNKVVMNILYRKYSTEILWTKALKNSYKDWQTAYEQIKLDYEKIALHEIVPILESLIKSDKKVNTMRFSDFTSYISSASKGDKDAIKNIEYTYFLNRIFDELIIIWLSFVTSGTSRIDAVMKLTGAMLPRQMPVNSYSELEQIFDQLGAEQYLHSLFGKEHSN